MIELLNLFFEEKSNILSIKLVEEKLGSYLDNIKKLNNFNRYLIILNDYLKFNNGIVVGKVAKKRNSSFLLTYNKDYFMDLKYNENSTLDGDIILYDIYNDRVLEFIKRPLEKIISTVKKSKKGKLFFELEDSYEHFLELVEINAPLIEGAVILVRVLNIVGLKIQGSYIKTIGHVDDPEIEVLKIVYNYNWPTDFHDLELKEADLIKVDIEKELNYRQDFRNLLTFTIDGLDAKDLDDAISLELIANSYRVGIHIADIGYLIKEGSLLDQEALKRGTSVYLGNKVIPMLPHTISNGLGSLNKGEDRLSLSVFITFNENFEQINFEIYEGIINVKHRLDYKSVNEFFHQDKTLGNDELDLVLIILNKIAKHLAHKRIENGALEFKSSELKFIYEKELIVDVLLRKEDEAENLIEQFMILANENVALYLTNLEYPSVYRIHEKPDLDKIKDSVSKIAKLGFKIPAKDFTKPKNVQSLANLAKNTRYEQIIQTYILRAMMKAKYVSYQERHFGLNSNCYTHFTAPIRRYPDLILNRIIHALVFNKSNFDKSFKHFETILPSILENNSIQERKAMQIERDVEKLNSINYLNNQKEDIYDAQIITILPSGMFVILKNGIEGFVALRNLNTYFYYNQETSSYFNDYGIQYKLGDFVTVKYIGYNLDRLEIDFEIINSKESKRKNENYRKK